MKPAGLIVGLGNPGKQYENTRHNFGFMAADAFMNDAARFRPDACSALSLGKKKCLLWKCFPGGGMTPWLVAKPQTYMNLSGEAVGHICRTYDIEPDQVVVLHDELDLPLGKIRFKTGGGLAGHNGLKSIASHLSTRDFHRLRLGIGRPEHGDVSNYVLGTFHKDDKRIIDIVLDDAVRGLLHVVEQGAESAIQYVNSFSPVS